MKALSAMEIIWREVKVNFGVKEIFVQVGEEIKITENRKKDKFENICMK